MFRRIERSELVTFSFLLSILAIIGAGLYDIALMDTSSLDEIATMYTDSYILGALSAAAGYVSIRFHKS
jgi:undecaprenyl-diphosphatase